MARIDGPLRLGVIGTGALGRHHVRLASQLATVELVGIYDLDPAVARTTAEEYQVTAFPDAESLAGQIEAAIVAVPTMDHAEVGCRLLERGIHVLVEKPIASTLAEADTLVRTADGAVLAVGHVEFFNPAVQKLLDLRQSPGFIEVHRLASFSARSLDIDVVLDLMIHDLQILHALDPSPVAEVRATGIRVLSDRIDIANSRIALESGCVANLTASRVSAERVRKLRVFLPSRGYYSLDYQRQEIRGFRLEARDDGPEILPDPLDVERQEPLKKEIEAFVDRCRGGSARIVDGKQGKRALETAIEVLEQVSRIG